MGSFRNKVSLAFCTKVRFRPAVDVWLMVMDSYNKALHRTSR